MNGYCLENSTAMLNRSLHRRGFMLGALAAVGLWATNPFPLNRLMGKRSIADLHFADFDALRGEHFQLYGLDRRPTLVQLDIIKNDTHRLVKNANPRQACFSLAFCAAKGLDIAQGSYTFAHPKLGLFDLFIVPTQAVAHEERYIAIINRL